MNAKFKVWDNIAKKMHIENTGFHLFSNGALGYNCGDVYDIVDKSNFEIIFYIGLKDKAGKEIYEGDILENPEKKKGVVVFYDGCFRLQIHKSETSVHYITMNQGYCENKTIIANSYENPELLTN